MASELAKRAPRAAIPNDDWCPIVRNPRLRIGFGASRFEVTEQKGRSISDDRPTAEKKTAAFSIRVIRIVLTRRVRGSLGAKLHRPRSAVQCVTEGR